MSTTLSALGTIGGLILNAYGMWAQDEANDEARRDAMAYNSRVLGLKQAALDETIAGRKAKIAFQKSESRKKWKWMEEERGYDRAQDFAQNFNSVLNREPAFKSNLAQIWGR